MAEELVIDSALALTKVDVERVVRGLVVSILALEDVAPESLDFDHQDLLSTLGGNSIDALELIISTEERLKFDFADDEMNYELIITLRNFIDRICAILGIADLQ